MRMHRLMIAGVHREPFPLLADPVQYTPDTLDIWGNRSEMDYWLGVLLDQVSTVVEKAAACDGQPGARLICGVFLLYSGFRFEPLIPKHPSILLSH